MHISRNTILTNPSYTWVRMDILELIEPADGMSVLDVGCSNGVNGDYLKKKFNATVYGVEYDEGYCDEASTKLDKVYHANLNKKSLLDLNIAKQFDYIIFGDILEHTIDPWQILKDGRTLLKENGTILISIPNINHYNTIFSLIFRGRWPYRKRGIHDSTHLRLFTRKNLVEMYEQCGLEIIKERRNLRLFERGTSLDRIKLISLVLDFFIIRRFFVVQYIHVLRSRKNSQAGK